jgi:LmeA-like phospholipid-binding
MRPPQRPSVLWVGLVAALAGALILNTGGRSLATAALRDALQSALGARGVRVSAESWPPLALWWGRIDELDVRADRVPAGTFELADFRAQFHHLAFDPAALYARRTLILRPGAAGTAEGVVPQAALAATLREQTGVRLERLSLRPGRVLVRAIVNILGADLAVDGGGRLVLGADNTLDFVPDSADAAGGFLTMQSGGAGMRLPVLRLPSLPLGLHLSAVRVGNGVLVLDATTNPL